MSRVCSRCSAFKRRSPAHGLCRVDYAAHVSTRSMCCSDVVNGWDIEWVPSGLKWKWDDRYKDWSLFLDGNYMGTVKQCISEGARAAACGLDLLEFGTLHDCAVALVARVNAERSKDA